MNHPLKSYILVGTIFVIIGAIYFIDTKSIKKTGSNEEVIVTPRISPEIKNDSPGIFSSDKKKKGSLETQFFSASEKSKKYELAREITTPDGFINTTGGNPITINELVGKKVILVDFWTYSCINCQRTTPYLNAWHEKYKDKGLTIVGIHTPEFEFEKDYQNVKTAVEKFGIKFPVVLDNDYSTWTAYKNRYWPRKYLIDIDGYVVYDHIGEGAYEETEKKIQELLEERKAVLGEDNSIDTNISKPSGIIESDFGGLKSPEIYFGASRNEYLSNGKKNTIGLQSFSRPAEIKTNFLYLEGDWNIKEEHAENKTPGAKIIFRYQAKNVYFVAGAEKDIKIKILKDGKFWSEQIIKNHKLYPLIEDIKSGEHTLEIIIEDPDLKAFTFTFG